MSIKINFYIMKSIQNIIFIALFLIANQYLHSQNLNELKKLQTEYEKVLEMQSLNKPDEIKDAEDASSAMVLPYKSVYSRKEIESLIENTEKLIDKLKLIDDSTKNMPFHGYHIFAQRDTIPFWQNLPIPKNYILGPGDELIISLWGETDFHISQTINRDGQIYIENVGILNIGGKSVEDAKKYILSRFSRVYSTLLGNNPKSFIDITLGELKSVNVHFVGFVNFSGVHLIHPFSNIITGLMQAGGINVDGTLRDIHLIRNGERIGSIDIYNYLYKGKAINNFRLMDQDIIYVPPRLSTIALSGQVKKPGYYEIIDKETISTLIDLAGGKSIRAGQTIFLYKNNYSLENSYLIDRDEVSKYFVADGDSIHVPIKQKINRFVRIEGQVRNPGKYPYQKNMSLNDLINATMTLNDKDFIKTADLSKIVLNRRNPSGESPIELIVNYNDKEFLLNNGDHITVSRINQFFPIESVIITGEINRPGVYPVNNLTNLSKIIDLSGGYTKYGLEDGIEIFRDSLKIGWHDKSFILNDGDSLNVLKKSGLVLINGEVNAPGYLDFKKGDSMMKYIKRAGGFSSFAEPRDIFIIYPNGTAMPYSRLFPPKVLEGSIITVNQRNISGSPKGPSGWEAFSIISTQAGNVATTLLTLMLLLEQSRGGSGS